jgi:outer membrane protein OmpA-like peptidoglycan-associated protein
MKRASSLLFAALLALPATARAQSANGFAADRFDPSERGSGWFAADSLDLRGHGRVAIGVVGSYAYKPLVTYDASGNERAPLVSDQLVLHPGASVVLWDRLRLGADIPVAVVDTGTSAVANGVAYGAPDGAAIGDVRVTADVRLLGKSDGPITIAAGVPVYLPTGSPSAFTGDGTIRLQPRVLAAGEVGGLAYAARLGVLVRPDTDSFGTTPLGTELTFAAAAGLHRGIVRVGPEIYGSTVASAMFDRRTTPFEAILGAHADVARDWRVGAAVGPGVTRGLGSPELRAIASIEWAPPYEEPAPPPVVAPPAPPPPPPPDSDRDGVWDGEDACPTLPGIKTDDPKTTGCPPDRDADGIFDGEDACPMVPGVRTNDPRTNGCPPDRDRDGIVDAEDACPDEPGPRDADPKKNGCPQAFVQGGQIRIRDPFKFRFNKTELDPAGDPILEAVLQVLEAHPEIAHVRIEGHTDDVGGPEFNQRLSEGRAAAVRAWLVAHGIDGARLTSVGYGQTRPIDTNDTEDGRRNNRRVEFHIETGAPEKPEAK